MEIDGKIVFKFNGKVYITNEINEPLEHVAKGYPVNKRLKSSVKIFSKKGVGKKNNKKEYVCSKCKEIEYNARIYKK